MPQHSEQTNGGVNNSTKIVLISSGQPSLNPRLVKEADTLADNGFDVLVIYAFWNRWGTQMDEQLLPGKKWRHIRAGGRPDKNPLTYFTGRVIFKLSALAVKKLRLNYFAEMTIARASFFLQAEAKKHKADLYIGHNLGALPAVVKAAKKFNKPCGFDAEDLHRYEVSDNIADPDVKLKSFIENKYIPQVDYLTVSSDQIGMAYCKIFPDKAPLTILNVFPKETEIAAKLNDATAPLRLFWFSQTIGHGRGLEEVIETLETVTPGIFELHLLGELSNGPFKTYLLDKQINIFIHSPIHPEKVIDFAGNFDIGLATETGVPVNRDLCLTNKIFTYMQAGLAVIASDTSAQQAFMQQYPTIGKVYKKGDSRALSEILTYFHCNREALMESRVAALALARKKLNWEIESVKFLNVVKQTLQQSI
jgi:glycosyltransferase involved in cell wall biosynthesis